MPGVLANASLRLLVEFSNSFASSATALKAERFTRLTPLDTTSTPSSSIAAGRSRRFISFSSLSPKENAAS